MNGVSLFAAIVAAGALAALIRSFRMELHDPKQATEVRTRPRESGCVRLVCRPPLYDYEKEGDL